ncbi:unnamed protein product [Fusarium graminearum]|uniref:Chromosome 4, complete genome n=2 Tax=Gibberella zeae TaxID=5518 RepID=A0A098DP67_GIBZE|nr:unnamed protein product [Fusarium graminearum]CAF3458511.1 unnamed protein product [Fusarium graminearum]CAF3620938.1 unnamed protein product [Fusarium graminearum]CAG1983363.1 unnamed protein product [Fusarium graminearum]CAG1990320.1 unnamed protein product [Fusarium graminearum]
MDFSLIEQQYRSEWINITETYAEAGVGGVKRMGYDAERPLSARNVCMTYLDTSEQLIGGNSIGTAQLTLLECRMNVFWSLKDRRDCKFFALASGLSSE